MKANKEIVEQESTNAVCHTCKGVPSECAAVPSLRHCEKANREDRPTVTKEEAQAAYGEIDDMKLSNEFAYMNWFMDYEETIKTLLKKAGAE